VTRNLACHEVVFFGPESACGTRNGCAIRAERIATVLHPLFVPQRILVANEQQPYSLYWDALLACFQTRLALIQNEPLEEYFDLVNMVGREAANRETGP